MWKNNIIAPGNDDRLRNGEQICKYLYAVIHIFLVRANFSGEYGAHLFDEKQILGVNTAPCWCPLISLISDQFALFWDNCAFGSI